MLLRTCITDQPYYISSECYPLKTQPQTFIYNRSVETCSWSSHEEDQRMSTATKDSGIHSNCDLDSHDDELSALHYKRRNKHCGHDSDSSDPRRGKSTAF